MFNIRGGNSPRKRSLSRSPVLKAVNLLYSGLCRISEPRDVIEIGAKNDRVHPFHSPSVSSPVMSYYISCVKIKVLDMLEYHI